MRSIFAPLNCSHCAMLSANLRHRRDEYSSAMQHLADSSDFEDLALCRNCMTKADNCRFEYLLARILLEDHRRVHKTTALTPDIV